jgi:hypothetical protein
MACLTASAGRGTKLAAAVPARARRMVWGCIVVVV